LTKYDPFARSKGSPITTHDVNALIYDPTRRFCSRTVPPLGREGEEEKDCETYSYVRPLNTQNLVGIVMRDIDKGYGWEKMKAHDDGTFKRKKSEVEQVNLATQHHGNSPKRAVGSRGTLVVCRYRGHHMIHEQKAA